MYNNIFGDNLFKLISVEIYDETCEQAVGKRLCQLKDPKDLSGPPKSAVQAVSTT